MTLTECIVLCVVTVCAVVAAATHTLDAGALGGIFGAVLGYVGKSTVTASKGV